MLRTKSGQETIRNIPANRILLETDAPFTMEFNSVNDLYNKLKNIAKGISHIRGEDIVSQIEDNSMSVFNNLL